MAEADHVVAHLGDAGGLQKENCPPGRGVDLRADQRRVRAVGIDFLFGLGKHLHVGLHGRALDGILENDLLAGVFNDPAVSAGGLTPRHLDVVDRARIRNRSPGRGEVQGLGAALVNLVLGRF